MARGGGRPRPVGGPCRHRRHRQAEHGADGWSARTVAVGYERIRGLRLKHQMPDGTFTVAKSRTVTVDDHLLRESLLTGRDDLFPGMDTRLRSRPGSRSVRITIGPGIAEIAIDPLPDGRAQVVASLPDSSCRPTWKIGGRYGRSGSRRSTGPDEV
jgi:hypothetical protein